jgi:hypothetical protein
MTLTPLVLWDVDRVLSPAKPTPAHVPHAYDGPDPAGKHVTGTVWLNPEHGEWMGELTAAGAAHAWATSWGHLAVTWIAPRLHPPARFWPVIEVGQVHSTQFGYTSKGQYVIPYIGAARPVFWIDDMFGGKDQIWAEDRTARGVPTVVRRITDPAGLVRADIDAALAWLAACAQSASV